MNTKSSTQVAIKATYVVSEQGVSVVEIMVAMALSLVLTLGVSQIYLSSKQTYRMQEAQSRIQENGRYALDALAADIRQTGYMGCPATDRVPVVIANVPLGADAITAINSLTGYEGTATAWQPSPSTGWPAVPSGTVTPVGGTDIISVQFARSCGAYLASRVDTSQNPVVSYAKTNSCSFHVGTDILVLADCGHVDVFRADIVTAGNATTNPTVQIQGIDNNTLDHFSASHETDSEVLLFNSYTYFIGLFSGEPSLYRRDNTDGSSAQPLVEGVEDMQILYGVDTDPTPDGSVDQYYKANDVYLSSAANWARIIAVRIDLLLRSVGDDGKQLSSVATNPCTGTALTSTQSTDNRLRKCFSSTISLRNPRI